jgi:hypothetical protein
MCLALQTSKLLTGFPKRKPTQPKALAGKRFTQIRHRGRRLVPPSGNYFAPKVQRLQWFKRERTTLQIKDLGGPIP